MGLQKDNVDQLYAKMLKAGVNVNDLKKLDECIPTAKVEPVTFKKEHGSKVNVELEKSSIEKLYAKLLKAGVNEAVLKDLDGGMLAESDLRSIEKLLDEKDMNKKDAHDGKELKNVWTKLSSRPSVGWSDIYFGVMQLGSADKTEAINNMEFF